MVKLERGTAERTKKNGGVSALQTQVTGTLRWVKGRVHCAEGQHSSYRSLYIGNEFIPPNNTLCMVSDGLKAAI